MPRLRNAAACCLAINNAVAWLDTKADDNEAWPAEKLPLAAYHKLPYLFSLHGRQEHARRLLQWIKEALENKEGAPQPNSAGATLTARQKTWLAMAAHMNGRYDISLPMTQEMMACQGKMTGAVYDLDPATGKQQETADVRTVACAGLLFLMTGHNDCARMAGLFLDRAIQLQTEQQHFYVRMDAHGRMASHFPREKAASSVLYSNRRSVQLSYLAVPVVFLTRLHLATGENEWLEAAMDYFLFTERFREEALSGDDSAALAWAGAALYGITRKRMFYDAAEKITQAWIQKQRNDGSWRMGRDEAAGIELTIQNSMCLLETLREAQ